MAPAGFVPVAVATASALSTPDCPMRTSVWCLGTSPTRAPATAGVAAIAARQRTTAAALRTLARTRRPRSSCALRGGGALLLRSLVALAEPELALGVRDAVPDLDVALAL